MKTIDKIYTYLNEGKDPLRDKIRELVGPGKTESAHGDTTIFFERGREPYNNALNSIKKNYEMVDDKNKWYITFRTSDKKVFKLKKFEKDTNNFVIFPYL